MPGVPVYEWHVCEMPVDGLEDVEVVRSGGPRAAVMPSKTDEMDEMDEYEDYSPPF